MAEKKSTRSKVKDQKWGSDDRADNLLANILDEAEAESAAEQRRLSAERKRKETLEREEQSRLEEKRRKEGQVHVEAERARQAELEAQRARMRAEIARAQHGESEETPSFAPAQVDTRAEKQEHEWARAQNLIAEQQRALDALTQDIAATNDDVESSRSSLGWIVMAALILIVAAGATYAFLPGTQAPAEVGEPAQGSYPTMLVSLELVDTNMTEVGLDLVAQAPDTVPTVIEAAPPEKISKPKRPHHTTTPKLPAEPALTVPNVFGSSEKIIH